MLSDAQLRTVVYDATRSRGDQRLAGDILHSRDTAGLIHNRRLHRYRDWGLMGFLTAIGVVAGAVVADLVR